jgi:hypothetical protein
LGVNQSKKDKQMQEQNDDDVVNCKDEEGSWYILKWQDR